MQDTNNKIGELDKLLKMNGERAKLLAKVNDTYVVYSSEEGVIREYPDGRRVVVDAKKQA